MSRPAWIAVGVIMAACLIVDYLDRNLKDPQVPAWIYGVVASLLIWRIDRTVRWAKRRRHNRHARARREGRRTSP